MRYWQLKAVSEHLKRFKQLKEISRVGYNILKLEFEKAYTLYLSLEKNNPSIFTSDSFKGATPATAPFDTILAKRFSRTKLTVDLKPNDKVLTLTATTGGAYKLIQTQLRLEFIPRNTNAIILDENGFVLEALRHTAKNDSTREIVTGKRLEELSEPPVAFEQQIPVEFHLETWLATNYEEKLQKELAQKKSAVLKPAQSRAKKLTGLLTSLEKEGELMEESRSLKKQADAILANLGTLNIHLKNQTLTNYHDENVKVEIPPTAKTPSHASELLFSKAKKLERKSKNIHIQREDIEAKLTFLQKLEQVIHNAKNIEELETLSQKQKKSKRSKKDVFETFFHLGYKIAIGRNQNENKKLLEQARAEDIWLHIRDIPSSHAIIKTDRKEPPLQVIMTAAKLCVDFSTDKTGDYEVDYTKRKFVKPKEGANVLYNKYKTLSITKE